LHLFPRHGPTKSRAEDALTGAVGILTAAAFVLSAISTGMEKSFTGG